MDIQFVGTIACCAIVEPIRGCGRTFQWRRGTGHDQPGDTAAAFYAHAAAAARLCGWYVRPVVLGERTHQDQPMYLCPAHARRAEPSPPAPVGRA